MARPRKQGLSYFPHDCDAVNDEKIEVMRAMFANDGYAFFFISLERIYRTENGELDISTVAKKAALAGKIGISTDHLLSMIETSFDIGLFNREMFEKSGVLTSHGVKKRLFSVIAERARKRANKGYSEDNTQYSEVFTGENTGNAAERKENKIKINKNISPPTPSPGEPGGKSSKRKREKREGREDRTPGEVIAAWEAPEDVKAEMREFVKARAATRTAMTGHAVELAIGKLGGLAGGDWRLAKKIVQQSIERGYRGLFTLKDAGDREQGSGFQKWN